MARWARASLTHRDRLWQLFEGMRSTPQHGPTEKAWGTVPGCDFTRRDFLRWTGVAAASPFFARRLFAQRRRGRRASRKDEVSPVNLELVTLTEDRAIITWYTGYTGTDDGLGRMEPAPADGVVHWGTNPSG